MVLNCVNPNAYEEWELEAFADGERLAHVADHLNECLACTAELNSARQIDLQLKQKLYCFDCPTSDEIRGYYWQHLNAAEVKQVEMHLTTCVFCQEELETLQSFALNSASFNASVEMPEQVLVEQEDPSTESWPAWVQEWMKAPGKWVEQLDIAVATLMQPSGLQGATTTAFREEAPISQSAQEQKGTSLLFRADDVMVSFIIRRDEAGWLTLSGQLLTSKSMIGASFKIAPALQESPLIEGVIEPQTGSFMGSGLEAGTYQLTILLSDKIIVIPNLILT